MIIKYESDDKYSLKWQNTWILKRSISLKSQLIFIKIKFCHISLTKFHIVAFGIFIAIYGLAKTF